MRNKSFHARLNFHYYYIRFIDFLRNLYFYFHILRTSSIRHGDMFDIAQYINSIESDSGERESEYVRRITHSYCV